MCRLVVLSFRTFEYSAVSYILLPFKTTFSVTIKFFSAWNVMTFIKIFWWKVKFVHFKEIPNNGYIDSYYLIYINISFSQQFYCLTKNLLKMLCTTGKVYLKIKYFDKFNVLFVNLLPMPLLPKAVCRHYQNINILTSILFVSFDVAEGRSRQACRVHDIRTKSVPVCRERECCEEVTGPARPRGSTECP